MINSIQCLRAIFTLLIILHHHNPARMNAGHIGVEFFFILSGMMLYNTLVNKEVSTIDYFISRWKRLWLTAAMALPLCIVSFWNSFTSFGLIGMVEYLLNDILCIGGIHSVCLNYPMWYVSVLIWGGTFLYALLRWNRNATIALIIPFLLVYTFSLLDSVHTLGYFSVYNGVPTTILRGLAEMGEGVILMHFICTKRNLIRTNMSFINVISAVALLLTIYIAWLPGLSEIYVVAFIPFFLIAAFVKESWLNKLLNIGLLVWLGGLSYEMFVLHAPIVKLFHQVTANVEGYSGARCAVLIVIIVMLSVGLKNVSKLLMPAQNVLK